MMKARLSGAPEEQIAPLIDIRKLRRAKAEAASVGHVLFDDIPARTDTVKSRVDGWMDGTVVLEEPMRLNARGRAFVTSLGMDLDFINSDLASVTPEETMLLKKTRGGISHPPEPRLASAPPC